MCVDSYGTCTHSDVRASTSLNIDGNVARSPGDKQNPFSHPVGILEAVLRQQTHNSYSAQRRSCLQMLKMTTPRGIQVDSRRAHGQRIPRGREGCSLMSGNPPELLHQSRRKQLRGIGMHTVPVCLFVYLHPSFLDSRTSTHTPASSYIPRTSFRTSICSSSFPPFLQSSV